MNIDIDPVEELLTRLWSRLPTGRDFAIRGADLAAALGVSERTIRSLVDELIDRGYIVGSVCSGERPGYFICRDLDDVEVGTGHLVSRAKALHVRVAKLRRAAEATFGPEVWTLFDLDEVDA